MKRGIIDNEAWYTVFQPSFRADKYIYHYTSISKAIKILNTKSLKFSQISKANDTMESKPKIKIKNCDNKKIVQSVRDYFINLNVSTLQLLCFTVDHSPVVYSNVSEYELHSNYSGRGFALPRMWAQYANDNTGVCLVFDKSILTDIIRRRLTPLLIDEGKVKYYDQFESVDVDYEKVKSLIKQNERYENDRLVYAAYNMDSFKNNNEFVKYNYFTKLKDWESENECRFLLYGDEDYYVEEITDALSGVVIGERIEPEFERIISIFCEEICEVKKISFTCNGCMLTNVYP